MQRGFRICPIDAFSFSLIACYCYTHFPSLFVRMSASNDTCTQTDEKSHNNR